MQPAGHPTRSSTVYDEGRWAEFLSHNLCAESECLSAADADNHPIHGRVWWQNGYQDASFPAHLRKYCFDCAFWHGYLENEVGGVVIEHDNGHGGMELRHYWFDPGKPIAPAGRGFLGFGGHKFTIKFFDGREVETNDLWHQGTIPDHFR